MNLHENKDAFTAVIQLAAAPKEKGGLGIKQVYLEKDYWICRSLKMLSECREAEVAVFKGGTSLSKAFGLGNRFSEDIDIAITSNPARSENQTKMTISRISRAMSVGLEEVSNPATRKFSKYRKSFYRCPAAIENDIASAINPGQILLEIVSLIRHSLAADYVSELKAKIRHFYDLHFLWNDSESRAYLQSEQFKCDFHTLLSSDQTRFMEPEGWGDKSLTDSPLISSFELVWGELQETYSKELPELAYQDIPSAESVAASFKAISQLLV